MDEEWQQMVKVKIHETGKIERSKQDMEDAMAGHTVEFSRTEQGDGENDKKSRGKQSRMHELPRRQDIIKE